jgi:hypothetical protein
MFFQGGRFASRLAPRGAYLHSQRGRSFNPCRQRVSAAAPPRLLTSSRTASRNSGWTSRGYKLDHLYLSSRLSASAKEGTCGSSTRCRRTSSRSFRRWVRKLRLRAVVPKRGERLLYCDHIDGDGKALFRLACDHDLEGIVAKRKSEPYLPQHASWLKIRNQDYSQWAGREELFERERGGDPDFQVWDGCAMACAAAQL